MAWLGLVWLGPFSVDTYLPASPAIEATLGASTVEVQQTLTAYMFSFAIMILCRMRLGGAILFWFRWRCLPWLHWAVQLRIPLNIYGHSVYCKGYLPERV